MSENTLQMIEEYNVKWVDLRFTDFKGKEQHITIPASSVDEDLFEDGQMFDGSSFTGWKGIDASDMIMMPDDSTPFIDPFRSEEHTSELQSRPHLVCRLLLEKKKHNSHTADVF